MSIVAITHIIYCSIVSLLSSKLLANNIRHLRFICPNMLYLWFSAHADAHMETKSNADVGRVGDYGLVKFEYT